MEWTRSSFVPHPPGVFEAKFMKWEEVNSDRFGHQVRLSFKTEELMEDGQPFQVDASGKPSLHAKGKVARMLKAFGVDAEEIEPADFDLDEYKGRKCRLVIVEYKGEDGSTKTKISEFLPLNNKKKSKPAETETRELAGVGASKKPDFNDDEDDE